MDGTAYSFGNGLMAYSSTLVRFPASWNQLAEKESHQINNLEQILVAKVFNFCGICSNEILHNITGDFDENHLHESHHSDEFFWEWRGPQSGLFVSAEQAEAEARKTVSWLQDL